eukprot:232686-Pyramimonas_sp.AAC.1
MPIRFGVRLAGACRPGLARASRGDPSSIRLSEATVGANSPGRSNNPEGSLVWDTPRKLSA